MENIATVMMIFITRTMNDDADENDWNDKKGCNDNGNADQNSNESNQYEIL